MRFIELTGKALLKVVTEHDIDAAELRSAGVTDECIVRVNEHGDIELRRTDRWDVVGGLLGNYADRLRQVTGREYA